MATKVPLTADQIVSRKRGWVTYIDDHGTQKKCRASAVSLQGATEAQGGNPNPSAGPAGGETKMARKTGKHKAKAESSGIRTIAGKAVNISEYERVKTAKGGTSYHNGDQVAEQLAGKSLDDIYALVAKKCGVDEKELRSKYKNLNPGMQRMNLGNRLRKASGLTGKAAA